MRRHLHDQANDLDALLQLRDTAEQARRVRPDTDLGRALDAAFDTVMALGNLVGLFGEGATRNPAEPFSRHFARRTRHVLATLPAADNPYLHQLLCGRYPQGHPVPWLTAAVPARLPEITWTAAMMDDALPAAPGPFDFIHLSNILDWLSPAAARTTLERVAGGAVAGRLRADSAAQLDARHPGPGQPFCLADGAGRCAARARLQLLLPSPPPGKEGLTMHHLSGPPSLDLAGKLAAFEEQFIYPLGPGRHFRITHGEDYPRFFRAMGEAVCFVVEQEDRVAGTLGMAIRRLILPDGTSRRAAYFGDLKIAPAGAAAWP